MLVTPDNTKTVKGERSGPFALTLADDPQPNCLTQLLRYLQMRFPAGQITSAYLFGPLTASQGDFSDAPLSSSALGKHLKKHLHDAELYAGESNHSFQAWTDPEHGVVMHGQISSIGQATQINIASIVDIYADLNRHLPRLDRLHLPTSNSSSVWCLCAMIPYIYTVYVHACL